MMPDDSDKPTPQTVKTRRRPLKEINKVLTARTTSNPITARPDDSDKPTAQAVQTRRRLLKQINKIAKSKMTPSSVIPKLRIKKEKN
jgi:hypothetical protein